MRVHHPRRGYEWYPWSLRRSRQQRTFPQSREQRPHLVTCVARLLNLVARLLNLVARLLNLVARLLNLVARLLNLVARLRNLVARLVPRSPWLLGHHPCSSRRRQVLQTRLSGHPSRRHGNVSRLHRKSVVQSGHFRLTLKRRP